MKSGPIFDDSMLGGPADDGRLTLSIKANERYVNLNGNLRSLFPVAANTALATAGAVGGSPGSPVPVGSAALGMMCTSMTGISLMRNSG